LEAAIKLGTHYLRKKRFSMAAEQFNNAAQINDEIVDAYIGLATAQKKLNFSKQAIQTLKLASSIQKNSVLLFTEAATLQCQSKLDGKQVDSEMSDKNIVTSVNVINAYQEQLKKDKNRADLYYAYGTLMMSEENNKAASDAFERAYCLDPTYYRAHHNQVLCLIDMAEPEIAIDALRTSESTGTGMFEKYYQMTMLYTDKKAFTQAYQKFAAAASVHYAQNTEICIQLQNILESLGVIDRSYMSWQRINTTSQWLLKLIEKAHFHNPMKF